MQALAEDLTQIRDNANNHFTQLSAINSVLNTKFETLSGELPSSKTEQQSEVAKIVATLDGPAALEADYRHDLTALTGAVEHERCDASATSVQLSEVSTTAKNSVSAFTEAFECVCCDASEQIAQLGKISSAAKSNVSALTDSLEHVRCVVNEKLSQLVRLRQLQGVTFKHFQRRWRAPLPLQLIIWHS